MMMMSSRNRPPFTATQWEELEHQALIFKYIVSGVPIPPDLLFPFKRSLDSSKLFPHQSIGWGCIQMGLGRKIDPEPGRCRRTDGKKWRCSKEASPDSKYCERHMHRGRNRSRKPVEVLNTNQSTTTSLPTTNTMNISNFMTTTNRSNIPSSITTNNNNPSSPYSSSSITSETHHHHSHSHSHSHPYYNNNNNNTSTHLHPFLYPHSSSSSSNRHHPDHNIEFSNHNNNTTSTTHHLVSDSGFHSPAEKDYRSVHRLKEGLDERSFFSEASGNLRTLPDLSLDSLWKCTPIRQQQEQQQQQQQQQHCFVLGTDFKSERPSMKIVDHKQQEEEEEEEEEETQQPLRRFFDEWPPKSSRDSWMNVEEERLNRANSYSTTQLSISIPMPQDFNVTRTRNDHG